MSAHRLFKTLSIQQRQELIRHIDRALPFVAGNKTVGILLRIGLLKPQNNAALHVTSTSLSATGREVVCMVLAEYAEALIAAGQGASPLEQLLLVHRPIPAHTSANPSIPEQIAGIIAANRDARS